VNTTEIISLSLHRATRMAVEPRAALEVPVDTGMIDECQLPDAVIAIDLAKSASVRT
jgi:hypothetical protein